MRKIILLLLAMAGVGSVLFAQSKEASWNFSAKKIADKTYEVHFTATIVSPWHIYSQDMSEGGPIPTSFSFNKNPLVTVSGKPNEVGNPIEMFEEVFDMKVKYYEKKVDFVQVVKLKSNVKTNITGSIEYMICTNEECLPPQTKIFSVAVQ